jgi:hypothetical protein
MKLSSTTSGYIYNSKDEEFIYYPSYQKSSLYTIDNSIPKEVYSLYGIPVSYSNGVITKMTSSIGSSYYMKFEGEKQSVTIKKVYKPSKTNLNG